jgi:hypothetical protein
MSQADFRQPYPGYESNDGFGNDGIGRSANLDNGPPPYRFGAGNDFGLPPDFEIPNTDQQLTPPASFGIEEPSLFSPFMVPPMLFPPSSGKAPQQQPLTSSRRQDWQQQEGVKVPKDPFLERQKKEKSQIGQSPSSPSISNSQEIKVPKDPFAERRKVKANEGTKVGATPFNEQQLEKKPREPPIRDNFQRQSATQERPISSDPVRQYPPNGSIEGMKQPRDPFFERMQQERRQQQQSRSPADYRTNFKPQSNNAPMSPPMNGSHGLGSVSFGSRSGDDMTYEEYSSYFDNP